MKKTAIIVSGYFNPLHKGHIEYFHKARSQGDELFVIINNDYQRSLKGSKEFMDQKERLLIINELKLVNKTFLSIDQDQSVCLTLKKIHKDFANNYNLAFANGGDQDNSSIPESDICNELGILLIDGLGKKIQSSSWILKKK